MKARWGSKQMARGSKLRKSSAQSRGKVFWQSTVGEVPSVPRLAREV